MTADEIEVPGGTPPSDGRSPMLELSNAMVRLYKDVFGRGPTKARSHWAGPDTLVVVLENSMTVAERNLASLGEHERLRDARLFFQNAVEHEFRATVERIFGRRTIAFVSGIDTRHDVAMELFTLAPLPAADDHPLMSANDHPLTSANDHPLMLANDCPRTSANDHPS